MTDKLLVDTMLDHPRSNEGKTKSMDPPEDSPTATLSFFSDCDMNEDEDQNVEQENLVSHVPHDELVVTRHDGIDTTSSQFDQSNVSRLKHEMQNWKRERQELLTLRAVVRKQQQQQEDLQAKLEVYRRQHQLKTNGTPSRDPNGCHVHSLSDGIEIVRQNLNSFPEDEIAFQLDEVRLTLKASQQQVNYLQDELIESQRNNERSNKENLLTRETLQNQLREAQEQLETERRNREDAMNAHKLQVELQQMKAKEDQEELNLRIDFWKDQFEKMQMRLYDQGVPMGTVEEEQHEQGDSGTDEVVRDSQQVEEMPCQPLDTILEEQQKQANIGLIKEGYDDSTEGEEAESQRSGKPNEKNDTVDSLRKELSEIKRKYQESNDHLTNLESVIHEMSWNQQTMIQKIQGVVILLQKTQGENEKLKKEKGTWQKTKRENEKLKKEKLALEKQRKEKLTMMTRNARR